MKPLPADFLEVLKKAHPDLTDQRIQEYLILAGKGQAINPDENPVEFEANRRQIAEFKKVHMPKYDRVWRDYCSHMEQARLELLGISPKQALENELNLAKEVALSDGQVQDLLDLREKKSKEQPTGFGSTKIRENYYSVQIKFQDGTHYDVYVDTQEMSVVEISLKRIPIRDEE